MSYFDDASLVMIPSGYKTSKVYSVKPTSGDGDLTFTRSNDTATRVNSAGLIEKVRTNELTYSNTFSDASWTKTRTSIVANSIANPIDGAVNASTLLDTADNNTHLLFKTISAAANPYTFSIYAKANGVDWIQVRFDNTITIRGAYFDLSTGTVGTQSNAVGTIESVGNGWYRCSISVTATAATFYSVVQLAEADNDNSYAGTGTDGVYLYASQLELGDIATDYIETTTAAVSVGPVANVPRLDYLNSSCPRLLLEPQRTNVLNFSEQLILGKAFSFTSGTFTVTENTTETLDPAGYNAAEKFNATDQSSNDSYTSTAGSGSLTLSIFAKKGTSDTVRLYHDNVVIAGAFGATFNLTSGTIVSTTGTVTTSIQNYGNGWYRCAITGADTAAAGNIHNVTTYAGTTYLYGVQLEQGAYATSYIPTLGAAVTRGADLAQKTSASALIGQTEGTIFWELDVKIPSATGLEAIVNIDNGAGFGNTMYIYHSPAAAIVAEMYVSGTNQATFSKGSITAGVYKCALAYANNNTAFFVNGVQVGSTDTSCSVPATSRIQMGQTALSSDTSLTNQLLLFPTRLSNADLAALTA